MEKGPVSPFPVVSGPQYGVQKNAQDCNLIEAIAHLTQKKGYKVVKAMQPYFRVWFKNGLIEKMGPCRMGSMVVKVTQPYFRA